MKIKLAILDDHQIVIDGLKLLLEGNEKIQVEAEFTNGNVLIETLPNLKIDILLTDVMMPQISGFEVAKFLKKNYPDIKIIALSMNGEGKLLHQFINEIEVNGYLLKTTDKQELFKAIETVEKGEKYFTEEIWRELEAYEQQMKSFVEIHLTSREIEIIQCIAKDLTNKQIADSLFISERTVETHRKNIFRKTDLHSVVSLIEFAKREGLV